MEFVEKIKQKAKSNLKTIVLPEAEEERNLKAADRILSEGFAKLILIGNPEKVHHLASELYLENIAGAEIVDPNDNPKKQQYVDLMLKLRASKGLTAEQAEKLIALSQKDYDPIFGESYEPFVAAYMQAMAAVAELVRPKEKDASADAKAWAEKLDFLLDQAYQNRKDMMAVWRETDAVCAAFEKRLEEEREKDK